MTAPAPSPDEQAVIERFGIFDEERIVEEVARALTGPDGDGPDLGGLGWDEINSGTQRAYRRLAVVAIDRYRAAQDSREGYHVELGGQRFTQAQWEAMLVWRTGTDMPTEAGRHLESGSAPVTAVDVDALDAARAALKEEFVSIGLDPGAGYYADALLPVVDRIANQRAAAELRAAADGWNDYDRGPAPKHVPTYPHAPSRRARPLVRAAGSPGTCGAGFRSTPSAPAQRDGGCLGVPEKPPDALDGRSEASTALPAQRTGPRVTTPPTPLDDADSATQEEPVDRTESVAAS